MEMEPRYESESSDEDVYFGPYTIREAKSDLRRLKNNLGAKTGRTPDRRHSSISSFNIPNVSTTSLCPNLEKLNISSNSEYVTCSEMSSVQHQPDNLNDGIIIISDDEVEPAYHAEQEMAPIISNIKGELDDYEEHSSIVSVTSAEEISHSSKFNGEFQTISSNSSKVESINSSSSSDLQASSFDSKETSSVPKISLNDVDSTYFNDTLEEINQFLKQGPDYVMPERKKLSPIPHISPVKERKLICIARHNPHEVIPLRKSKSTEKVNNRHQVTPLRISKSAEKVNKPTIQVDRAKTVEAKTKHTKIPSFTAKNLFPDFKVPTKPVKAISNSYKNVVSPVGVYIKNTPKYCALVKTPKISQNLFIKTTSQKPSRELDTLPLEIPKVIYQPAKTKVQSTVTTVHIPNSIKSKIASGVVSKHEARIEGDIGNQSIERRLIESELSLNLSECPMQDVSVLTHKQPYNFKR